MEEKKKVDLKTINGFVSTIVNYKSSISKFLNPRYGITPEDFIETCIRAVKENPKLLQCDPKSLFGAVLLSAEIGLKPNTSQQHSFIIPYKGQAKFQIGYKGLIEIMYRNPRVKKIDAHAVYENDDFDYAYGLNPYLKHKPARKDKGKLDCVYATCLVDNEPIFVVVEKAELDSIRNISQTIDSQYSPYNNGTDIHNWMEIKASVKALSKLIPTSNNFEMAKAVEYDSKFEGGARVLVEIPNTPNEIVEPKLVDGNFIGKTLDTAFDLVDDFEEENSSQIIQAPEPIKQEIPVNRRNPKNTNISRPDSSPIDFEKPISIQQENHNTQPIQIIKEKPTNIQNEPFEWELETKSTDNKNDTFEFGDGDDNDNDDDISFEFPDNDEDDDEEMSSNLL
jgi:recombination protein RecT